MYEPRYAFTFAPIQDRANPVVFSDLRVGKERGLTLRLDDEHLRIRRHWQQPIPAAIADLIDIAVAVFVADRLAYRPDNTRREIHVDLPLRLPGLFVDDTVQKKLKAALRWYTEDNWNLSFTRRLDERRLAEEQMKLPETHHSIPTEVALWSGGLDSLAGAFQRLLEPSRELVLCGTGSSSFINKRQRRLGKHLKDQFPGRVTVMNIPIDYKGTGGINKNKLGRARGFAFLLMGAACAWLSGQDTLNVYENGVGAINLPFRASEVGIDHSRAVHPYSLYLMAELVTAILGEPFYIRNPFSFSTKGQMVAALGAEAKGWYQKTFTCDRPRRRPGKLYQCGHCTSCLLRRQAITASEGYDATRYDIVETMSRGEETTGEDGVHLRAMLYQVEQIIAALHEADPWYALLQLYPEHLPMVVHALSMQEDMPAEEVQMQLLAMYQLYVDEWGVALPKLRDGLLPARPIRIPVARDTV